MKRIVLSVGLLLIATSAFGQDHTESDHRDVVVTVKNALVAQGVSLQGSCGAFQITKRVAWLLREEGFGLIAKGGNHCEGYSVDAVILPSGLHYDILVDAGTFNGPSWNLVKHDETQLPYLRPGDYREPFDPGDSPMPTPIPVPDPPVVTPTPLPSTDLTPVLLRLNMLEAEIQAVHAELKEFRAEVKRTWKDTLAFLGKYVLPVVSGLAAGKWAM